jgi:hypothetical protein
MSCFEPFFDPGHKMILESTLDALVEDIGCEQLMNVCPRKVMSERLWVFSAMYRGT